MATEIKPNVVKVKPIQDGSSKGKAILPVNKKKTKEKTTPSSSKTSTTTTKTTAVKVKSQRKAYSLPGQKYDPPEEREPLRIFYESLSNQIPSSEMAEFWMMEHGLLSPERAKRAYERKQKRQQQLRSGAPIKSLPVPSRAESSQKQQVSKNGDLKAKKRLTSGSDDDEDFIMKRKKGKG
ncbi:hypothetical protein BVC80_209g312 [Macleaya cordata]|uniref:Uncharacterized protein n=1 Tax=Macleaya cordata TaxID=56857 RepID=A0A200QDU4_MACCD|nr:hypothetical protein BVC80_209g312 [Macleaya cordata]